MAKTISLEFNGRNYTLEYTRKSVETLERSGFVISDIGDKPVTTIPTLFWGAFLANHRAMQQSVTNEIFKKLKNKESLIDKLAEMYGETMDTLMDEPEEGNLEWETNW